MTQTTDKPNLQELLGPFNKDWKSTTRSIRIDGTVTSVRLETFYWHVLGEIAQKSNMQVPELMTRLSRVAKSGVTNHTNFTSFVRVCCGRYLDGQLTDIKQSVPESIESTPGTCKPVAVHTNAVETRESIDE